MRNRNGFEIKDMAILMAIVALVCLILIAYMSHLYDGGMFR